MTRGLERPWAPGWPANSGVAPLAGSVHAARLLVRLLFGLVFALPIAAALVLALVQAGDAAAWSALLDDPQTLPAWRLSVVTALGSTLFALALAVLLTTQLHGSRAWRWLQSALAPMLAVPHAAFAIGLALLVMPAGLFARLLAPLAGWSTPPDWHSVNDPHGVMLIVTLTLKELPFLLWNLVALLARPELAAQIERHQLQARTLGYRVARVWWRVLWPLLLPRLAWPLLAVLAYSLSVVDVALVVGPLGPPTLAVLAWQSLLDADPARQALGAVQVACLALTLAIGVGLGWLAARIARRVVLVLATSGRRGATSSDRRAGAVGRFVAGLVALLYLAALILLALAANAGPWPFPQLLPSSWQPLAGTLATAASTLAFSAALAALASVLALVVAVAWLEATDARFDAASMPLLLAPLAIPPLLLLVGLYRGALEVALDGSFWGLVWVHVIVVLPYSVIVLAPAWRSFDPRYETTALAFGRRRLAFWWRVKWPLLRAPIAATLAVGFAVAVGQYLPTLFIGAGRYATVTTEAVTLAAGGQRQLAAAYALWQALLPLAGFALATALSRRAPASPTDALRAQSS